MTLWATAITAKSKQNSFGRSASPKSRVIAPAQILEYLRSASWSFTSNKLDEVCSVAKILQSRVFLNAALSPGLWNISSPFKVKIRVDASCSVTYNHLGLHKGHNDSIVLNAPAFSGVTESTFHKSNFGKIHIKVFL